MHAHHGPQPSRFLLVPRVLALLCAVPCLTILSNLAGIFGGYWVGVLVLGLGSRNYIQQTAQSLLISDLVTGLVKSLVFALLIGLVSCYRGFYVRGGAEGVGTIYHRVSSNINRAVHSRGCHLYHDLFLHRIATWRQSQSLHGTFT
jgi:ABC-type transporter Mla maintaining outer membrane lipid asymmetry permease subunit MlaE